MNEPGKGKLKVQDSQSVLCHQLVRFFHAIDIQEYRSLMQTVKLKILQPLVHHELVI